MVIFRGFIVQVSLTEKQLDSWGRLNHQCYHLDGAHVNTIFLRLGGDEVGGVRSQNESFECFQDKRSHFSMNEWFYPNLLYSSSLYTV